jgi:hypothetical protein
MNIRLRHISRVGAAQIALACLLALLGSAPTTAATGLSSKDEFNAGKARIDAELLADRAACDKLSATPRDVCREQARGKDRVAQAELELAHTGSRKSQDRLTTVRMDANYDIARTQCNDKAGAAKAVCTKEAQTARTKAQADLRLSQRVTEAQREAADDRRDAEYKLATEKCDAMAEDPRAACIAAAKAKAGKS